MRRLVLRIALWLGAVAVIVGVGMVLALAFGRPTVRVESSRTALASIDVGGFGARVTSLQVVANGHSVPVVQSGGGTWPTQDLAQGEHFRVTASVDAPSWLRWLFGSPVTSSLHVRTPEPAPTATVSVASARRMLPVRFTSPVTSVEYRVPGGTARTMHLARPARMVKVPVPRTGYSGTVEVTATSRAWERMASRPRTVSWFIPPVKGQPAALAVPAPGGTAVSSESPVTLTFSEPVSKVLGTNRPTLSPDVPGRWSEPDPYTLSFTPSGFGFGPDTQVTVRFDHAVSLVSSPADPISTTSYQFTVGPGSVLRLQQLLAQLGYLPLTFTPASGTAQPTTLAAEEATVYAPLRGSFAWRWSGTPASLVAQWAPGQATAMTKGALMTFEAAQNTYNYTLEYDTVDQMATASVWTSLLKAALANERDPFSYSYIYVTKVLPETLTMWENGQVAMTALANTGIPQSPTADGTYPIYLRYKSQVMRGTNPNGTPYADSVSWVNYFNGSDAVHGFVRASYGFPQSVGCVELPPATAGKIFPQLMVGDLVTVAG